MPKIRPLVAVTAAMFLLSFSLILFELLLTRLFAIVLFAQFAHLALALALLGISLGAIAQHLRPSLMPDEGLEKRLAMLSLLQGVVTVLAVWACLEFPIITQFEEPPDSYGDRSMVKDNLLNWWWFAALLPVLTAPFSIVGLSFAGTFHRRREHIGLIYGADLIGGAIGAVVFIPILAVLAGPDLVFLIGGATGLSALLLYLSVEDKRGLGASGAFMAACLLVLGVATTRDIFHVRFAAGFSEDNVTYSRWTPLARLSVHESDKRTGVMILLDNSSASDVLQTQKDVEWAAYEANHRSMVHRLHDPGANIAILAASAGPDVAVAQLYGHTKITAIDIAGDIFDIVAEKYPDAPKNPYTHGDTIRSHSDGRAAILHAHEPFDIIQMVHANLWSSAGLLSNAWSPALLETTEAFETYLDHLTEDGTISFSRGSATRATARAAAEALRRRGASEPARHIFYLQAPSTVLLVKKRPWTEAEVAKVKEIATTYRGKPKFIITPTEKLSADGDRILFDGPLMTDDRPYLDGPSLFFDQLKELWATDRKADAGTALAQLYRSIVIQSLFVLVAGALFLGVPFVWRGPTQLQGIRGVGAGLLYVSCLGYGYLSVETILVHELILFVGHPTYAITVVILSMLLFSGLGSVATGRLPYERVLPVLRGVLITVVVLGAVQAYVVPGVLHAFALGWPLWIRIALTFLVLAPLGFVMGTPFPLAMRLLDDRAGGLVPWAWALNGWMSVVASLVTVMVSRMYGYSWAFTLALAAYAIALAVSGQLPKIGTDKR